ncbi:MAG: hypothetical protein ACE14L_17610 [Terriglobales bacterium]
MKLQKTILIITLILPLFVPAFAGTRNKGSFTLSEPAKVAGVQLAPGQYVVKWEGDGQNVQVSILKDGQVVATPSTTVLDVSNPHRGTATYLATEEDGTKLLTRIDLAKKALVFRPNAEAASARQ